MKQLQIAAEWFKEYAEYADTLRAKLDAMQETVLTEELRRIGESTSLTCHVAPRPRSCMVVSQCYYGLLIFSLMIMLCACICNRCRCENVH